MNNDTPHNEAIPMGTHLVHVDGDSLEVTARGQLTGDDMQQLFEHFARIKQKHGMLFVLYNGAQCTGLDEGARKLGSKLRGEETHSNLRVAFGLPFTVHVILNMILRAHMLLRGRTFAVHVFKQEHEARAFFVMEREKLRRTLQNRQ